jgi:hypothetical protein
MADCTSWAIGRHETVVDLVALSSWLLDEPINLQGGPNRLGALWDQLLASTWDIREPCNETPEDHDGVQRRPRRGYDEGHAL